MLLPVNPWIDRLLFLALGLAFGWGVHVAHDSSRFIWDKDSTYVLDTKTGQLCAPVQNHSADVPVCLEVYKHW